jgi:tRNA G10  N-methylase Trm11
MIRDDEAVLDPFAGSAATLLAASLIAPEAQTVGIEVVSDALLSRENIRRDFSTRGLKPPLAVIEGDVMDATVRNEARKLIGDKAFDVIVTDPPWGRREAASKMLAVDSALSSLIDVIKYNRLAGNPILKKGGRLVIFQPCHKGQRIEELLPSDAQLQSAGLQLQDMKEQRLNDGLSRWVLSFLSV